MDDAPPDASSAVRPELDEGEEHREMIVRLRGARSQGTGL
jgi:hypothetical protein